MTAIKSIASATVLLMGIGWTVSAVAQDPYARADNTWISIDGTVTAVSRDTFELDYGAGTVTVEMDDGDRDADAYKLISGDRVTVNGVVDDEFFETTTIEAGSVYVEKLDTYFYASTVDEEGDYNGVTSTIYDVHPVSPGNVTIRGTVTEITGGEEFLVDTGLQQIEVEIDELDYDPLDADGYQRIQVGDRVSVTGSFDDDFLEGRELVASRLTELWGQSVQ